MNNEKIKYADLFAGCGGLSYGFYINDNFKHILATDIWEQAKDTYNANFSNSKFLISDLSKNEEVIKINALLKEGLDLLIGGPPCKGFSTLNNSKVLSKYNTLVDQYLKIVEGSTPKIFIIENVRGFQSKKHPTGITYPEHVRNVVSNFKNKYHTHDFLLNANDYGIPQNRIRYFMIGVLADIDKNNEVIKCFVNGLRNSKLSKRLVLRDAIKDLPRVKVREGEDEIILNSGKVVFNHKSMNHSIKLEERLMHVPKGGGLMDVPYDLLTNHLKKVVKGEYGSGGFAKNIYGRMDWDKPSGTIVAGMDKITVGRFVHPDENRLLTPRECARIQSFPDDFKFLGGMVSQYYQIGNAVPPKLSIIFANIIESIFSKKLSESKLECSWN